MKKITVLLILTLMLLFIHAFDSRKIRVKRPLLLDKIESISILKCSGPPDSIKAYWKKLSKKQTKRFVEAWNEAKYTGLTKFVATYKINVEIKNDSSRNFRYNGNQIKENSDRTFRFKEENLIEKFYEGN